LSDNITQNAGSGGSSVRTKDVGGNHHQFVITEPLLQIVAASTITRPANTTAYAALDAVSNNATAGSVTAASATVSDANDNPVILHSLLIHTTDTGFKNKTMRVFAFNADPTSSTGIVGGDNAAYSTKNGSFIGSFVGTFRGEFTDGAAGIFTPEDAQLIATLPTSGAATIYFLLETLDAATPSANSTTFIITVRAFQSRAA
jgi:hypothetical protein